MSSKKERLRKKLEERRAKRETPPESDPSYNHSDRFHDWEFGVNIKKIEE